MIAEILATGDEVRSGALVDTNSAYIAERLELEGVPVVRHDCVGDDLEILASVMREIAARVDIAIVTGGLGPTSDDLTAAAAARAAGVELALDPDALASIEKLFKALGRPLLGSNRKQAMLPENADCLYNPIGTAPGFVFKIDRCTFFCLPGVPREMRRMLADETLPRIRKLQGDSREFCRVKTICTFGTTESAAGELLSDFEASFPELQLGLRARVPEIQVKFYARGRDEQALERMLDEGVQWVVDRFGDKVFSTGGDPMEVVVGGLLVEKKATLAVAESCTGGLIAHWLTDVSGSSDYFLFSGVTYSNEAKMEVLGVSPETLAQYGAVSEETVREMAEGARRVAGATYAISTSGVAGPTGGSDEKPVGTVCIGLAGPDSAVGRRFHFPFGNRGMKKKLFAMKALDLLRRELT